MSQQPPWPPQQPPYSQQPYGQAQWGQQPPQYAPPQQFQQTQQPLQPVMKSPFSNMVSIGTILIIAGVIFTILTHSNSSVPTSPATPAKVGDTITIDGTSCTLISATDTDAPGYLTIKFNLVNNSGSEYNYYTSDFHIINSFGSIIDPEVGLSGALAPGGHGIGILNFQINDLHNTKLLWQPVGHSNDLSHVWDLGL
jgi:hypothetical protein